LVLQLNGLFRQYEKGAKREKKKEENIKMRGRI
jgi:hypothetical protein